MNHAFRLLVAAFIACSGLLGCVTVPVPTEVAFEDYGGIDQAAFALGCPREQLQIQVLQRFSGYCRADRHPSCCNDSQVGVTGCGHRAVYVCVHGQWLNNTPPP